LHFPFLVQTKHVDISPLDTYHFHGREQDEKIYDEKNYFNIGFTGNTTYCRVSPHHRRVLSIHTDIIAIGGKDFYMLDKREWWVE
jgi:hypothetical protein